MLYESTQLLGHPAGPVDWGWWRSDCPLKRANIPQSHNQNSLENQALCPCVICQLFASRGSPVRSEWVSLCSVTLLMTHAGLWVTNLWKERLSCTLHYTSEFHGILVTVIGNTIWWGIASIREKLIWCTAISQSPILFLPPIICSLWFGKEQSPSWSERYRRPDSCS